MSNSLKIFSFSLSKLFFYALILLLPFNINWVRFTETSFYFGYHVFYNSSWFYLTDIIICGVVLIWGWKVSMKHGGFKQVFNNIFTSPVFYFWLISAISIIVSRETLLGFYGAVKISEFLLIFLYVKHSFGETRKVLWLIVIGAMVQSVIGILQFQNQHSIGLKSFGETFFAPMMKGIAEFPTGETVLIRAYGTFPHPNLLGVWLFTALISVIWLIYAQSRQDIDISRETKASVSVKNVCIETFLGVAVILISTGIVLTFSRTIWLVTALAIAALLIVSRLVKRKVFECMQTGQRETGVAIYHPRRIALVLVLLLVSLGLNWIFYGQEIKDRIRVSEKHDLSEEEAVVNRQLFNNIAWEAIKDHPGFGLGMRNLVVRMGEYSPERLLPHLHQPVHNLYLLITAELGLVGFTAFVWLLFNILKQASLAKLFLAMIFGGFLFLGLFDHYFWSLQQGGLLFWIMAGLLAHKNTLSGDAGQGV
ncbi:MAG: hypothetical protein A3A83_04230 [Candidatus Doudnabacteria bacterium RIFCSPLOWO2_01_FULL_48_57]|nr:MAG: hypothetical protein A3A83_04230 [Candidatus Doudnabacteria bacterium RIFCSPLOWO2_01_FULL_48_57]